MNKEQTDILIDIVAFGIIMAICIISISQIPNLEPMLGGLVLVVLVLSILGILVTSGLIYACIKDLNDARDDEEDGQN